LRQEDHKFKASLNNVVKLLSPNKSKKKRAACSRGRDQEDHGSRSARAKSSQNLTSTNKKLGLVVHACHLIYAGSKHK
jgi:hypothetical protein